MMSNKITDGNFNITASSLETMQETDKIRLAQYPDGTQKIQRATLISSLNNTRIQWNDLPIVMVDQHGKEIQ